MTDNEFSSPVEEWLQANGVDTAELMDERGELRITHDADGVSWITYQLARWPDGRIALHGSSMIPYTGRAKMVVPPPPGLLESYQAVRRQALADDRARHIATGLQGVVATVCGPDDRLVIAFNGANEDTLLLAREVLAAAGLADRAVIIVDASVTVVRPGREAAR